MTKRRVEKTNDAETWTLISNERAARQWRLWLRPLASWRIPLHFTYSFTFLLFGRGKSTGVIQKPGVRDRAFLSRSARTQYEYIIRLSTSNIELWHIQFVFYHPSFRRRCFRARRFAHTHISHTALFHHQCNKGEVLFCCFAVVTDKQWREECPRYARRQSERNQMFFFFSSLFLLFGAHANENERQIIYVKFCVHICSGSFNLL